MTNVRNVANVLNGKSILSIAFFLAIFQIKAQNIGVFTSVRPTSQKGQLVLPPTHDFQVLAQTGDTLADGSLLKYAPDFTAFVPIQHRSDKGYLSINHEIAAMKGGVTVFDLSFDYLQQLWQINNGLPIDFSALGGINRPCSGGITPWGTVISGEESIVASDLDSNGYYDAGWLVESSPRDRKLIQKIWKAGNAVHENCAIASDQKTIYWGADDFSRGFIFKYIAHQKQQLSEGKLFVLLRTDSAATTASWVPVPNATPKACNNINAYCQQLGAWNFSGVEDVEIGPDGKVYFATKFSGRVWRFKDKGPTVSDLEVFVENTQYPIETMDGTYWAQWGVGADNLAFDGEQNLWVLQDGGDNHIWMVKPAHTAVTPQIALFATTPGGGEPTGITFTPNKRFMFLSFQNPSIVNGDTMKDVTGKPVVFNRGTTVVIARKEYLGTGNYECPEPVLLREAPLMLEAFPNPVKMPGIVQLRSDAFQIGREVDVTIFDPLGAICHSSRHIAGEKQITLPYQPQTNGAYVVRVMVEGEMGTTLLLVQH